MDDARHARCPSRRYAEDSGIGGRPNAGMTGTTWRNVSARIQPRGLGVVTVIASEQIELGTSGTSRVVATVEPDQRIADVLGVLLEVWDRRVLPQL